MNEELEETDELAEIEPEFSDRSATALRTAGQRLLAALSDHIELAAASRSDDELAELDRSSEDLRDLLVEYADRQERHCGEPAPWEDDSESDASEYGRGEDEPSTTAVISRLIRSDFMIIDEAALIADAERIQSDHRQGPPLRHPERLDADRAVQVIIDQHGPDGLWQAKGVRPLWSETVFLRPDPVELDDDPDEELPDDDRPDDAEPDDHPLSIFDVDGAIVHRQSEQFFR